MTHVSSRSKRGKSVVGIATMVVAIGLCLGPLAPTSRAGYNNDDPAKVSVYDWNIHKMDLTWTGWGAHINSNNIAKPDLILLQDMESSTERVQFQNKLAEQLGGTWSGRGFSGWGTAIVWRDARFSQATSRTWWGWGDKSGGTGCVDDADGTAQDAANGAPATQVRLHDDKADKWVSAVAFKTGPNGTDVACAWKNSKKVDNKLNESGWSGALLFMGMDQNAPDRDSDSTSAWTCWYAGTNGSLGGNGCGGTDGNQGYRDPIYVLCGPSNWTCFNNNDTRNENRIDYVLAKKGAGGMPTTSGEDTLPLGGTNGDWSDHRSVRALFNY